MSVTPLLRDESYEIKTKEGTLNIAASWLDVEDVFRFHNTKPYVILAGSGGGKTSLCMDILFKKAKEATAIHYISETVASTSNNVIASLPNAIRSKCTIENLISTWREITNNKDYYYGVSQSNSTNSSSVNNLIKIYNTLITIGNLKAEDLNWRKAVVNHYESLFASNDWNRYNLPTIIQKIGANIEDTYFNNNKGKIRDEDPNKPKKLEHINEEAKHRGNAFIQETLQRIIINIIILHPSTLKTAANGSLSTTELNIINGFYSEKPKTIFIIDDCTDTLQGFQKSTNKTMGLNGQYMPVRDAYNELITSIFTRARHSNCMVCIFTHMLSVLPCKDNIHNIILLDNTVLTEINRSRSISNKTKDVFNYMNARVFGDAKYKYCYVYYNEANTPNNVFVGKAQLHIREEIEYNNLTKKYFKVYDMFNNEDQDAMNNDNGNDFRVSFALNDDNDDDGEGDDEEGEYDEEEDEGLDVKL